MYIARRNATYGVQMALRMLRVRRLVNVGEGGFRVARGEAPVLEFYANAIAHLLRDA